MSILNIADKESMENLVLLQKIRDLATNGSDSFVYDDEETLTKMFSSKEAMNNTLSGTRVFGYGASKGLHAGKALSMIDGIGVANWLSLSTPDDILNDSTALNEVFVNNKAFKYMKSLGLIEYIPIDYIESTGAQYIKTGWMYGSTNYTGCKIKFESELGLSDGKIWVVTGCGSGTNLYVGLNQSNKIYYGNGGSDVDTGVTYNGNKCIFELDLKNKTLTVTDSVSGTVYVNVSNITLAAPSRTSQEFFLFAYSNTSDQAMMHTEKLYMYQIYENDTLVCDFVPAKDFNGVICLYDKVTKQFFYNAGTGDFLYDHIHEYGDTWLYTETHHWKACNCGEKSDLGTHIDADADGFCDTCSYKIFTPVEYIESTGKQYINTGYSWASENVKVEMGFEYTKLGGNSVFGSEITSGNKYSMVPYVSTSAVSFYVGSSQKLLETAVAVDTHYDLTCEAVDGTFNMTLNGSTKTASYAGSIQNNRPIYIFANNNAGGDLQQTSMRLKYFRMYDNGVLVHDFIPAQDNKGVSCLFDKVGMKLFYNIGNGSLYDNMNPLTYTEIEYVKSVTPDGSYSTGYFDSGVIPNANTRVVMDFQLTTYNTYAWLYGVNGEPATLGNSKKFGISIPNFNDGSYGYSYMHFGTEGTITDMLTMSGAVTRSVIDQSRDKTTLTISGGTTYTIEHSTIDDSSSALYSMYLLNGRMGEDDIIDWPMLCKLYSCQIYDGESLIKDFIPVLDVDGVPCLYDKINKIYHYNLSDPSGIEAGPEI